MTVFRARLETGSEAVGATAEDKLFPLPFLPRLPSNLLPHLCSTLFHTQMDPVLPNVGTAELLFFSQPCPLLLCSQHLINTNHWRPFCRSFNFSVKASSFACWNFDFFSLLFSSVRHSSKSETSLATMLYSCLMGILALAESGRASRTGIAADCLVLLVMVE